MRGVRHPGARHHGGPRQRVRPGLRPHRPLPQLRRSGRAAGRGQRLQRGGRQPVLRLPAGQSDRLGPAVRGRHQQADPHADGVPHPRRQNQHPLPAEGPRPPDLPLRRDHHPVHRFHPGAVQVPGAEEPGHQAAAIPGRDDRQRERTGQRPPARAAPRAGPAAEVRSEERDSQGQPGQVQGARPGEVRRLDPRAGPAAHHGHHLPRRPPVPAGHPRPHPGHAERRRGLRPPAGRAVQPGDVGRGDLRRFDALPEGVPLAAAGGPAGGLPERAVPDAAPRQQRGRVHELPGQRGEVVRQRDRRRRAGPVPRVRRPELDEEHAGRDGGCPGDRRPLRSLPLLHRRPARPQADEVRPQLLRHAGEGAGIAGGEYSGDQGHGRPLQTGGGPEARQGAAGRDGPADPLPHARHRRHPGGEHPQRRRRGPGRGGRRDGAALGRHGPR